MFTGKVSRRWTGWLLALVTLLGAAFPLGGVTEGLAAPDDPIPSAFLDPDAAGWYSVRNMTSAQFSAYFDEKSRQGYMVIDIEVDEVTGEERVGAVFQQNLDNRGWFEYRNLPLGEFESKNTELRGQGYRMIDQEYYVLDNVAYYAGVWIFNKENLEWVSYHDQTDAEFSEQFQRYTDAGFLMIDIDVNFKSAGMRYDAVWVKNSENLSWHEWRDLTSAEFSVKFDEYKDTHRMIDIESYQVGPVQFYAGIWVENKNGRGWFEYRDMTAKGFGDKWLELRDAGYRLIDYETYATANGQRYAGIWRQNSNRPNWALKTQVDALFLIHQLLYNTPGMSVAIIQNGEFVYQRGFGFADLDDEVIAHSGTIYRLASISKAVGGAMALNLSEQGVLDLDAPTSSFVPILPAFHTHTVEETISNRSGIGHYDTYGSLVGSFATATGPTMLLMNTPLFDSPGTYEYSTHAYTFLGAAMEGATGFPLTFHYTDTWHTTFNLRSLLIEDRSIPNKFRAALYDSDNDEVSADDQSWKVLGGGLEASAYDLALFGYRLINGEILTPDSLTKMWTPPDNLNNYALGWNTGTESGTQVVAKNGANNGARSYLRMYPTEGIVIVVLSNRKNGGHDPVFLGREIGKLMLAQSALFSQSTSDGPSSSAGLTAMIDPLLEPVEEGQNPVDIAWPVDSPVSTPAPADLQEGPEAPINETLLFLPLIQGP